MNWRDKLEYLRTLTTNWDSYGASEIDPQAICRVNMIMLFMEELDLEFPTIAANVRGGVDLEWDEFEITVHPGPRFEYHFKSPEIIEDFYASPAKAYSLILKHLGEE